LWYRFKSKCKEYNIPFNLKIEDIEIPQVCELTGLEISSSLSDRFKDNYYTIIISEKEKGFTKDNIKIVSVLASRTTNRNSLPFKTLEKNIYYRAKESAKKRKIEFNIEPSDILIPSHCPLLDIELSYDKLDSKLDNYYSIDRIDSSKGYVKGNIQVISLLANTMKNKATKEQLKTFAKNILDIL